MLEKFNPIKQRYQLLAFVMSWIVCYNVLATVLNKNFESGLYPPEADSLSIPIFTNVFLGFFIFITCAISTLIPKTKILGIFSILGFTLASLLTLSGVPEWLSPNHYLIAIAHLIPLHVCLYMLLSSVKLRSLKIENISK